LRQLVAAERGLASPDREQHIAGHAELLFDGGERGAVLDGELLSLLGEPRDVGLLDVVGRRLDELGLPARRRAFPARQIEVGQRQIGLEPAGGRIEGAARDPHARGLRPQIVQPFAERRIDRRAPRRRGRYRKKPDGQQDRCTSLQSTHRAMTLSRFAPARTKQQKTPKVWKRPYRTATMNSRGKRSSTLPSKQRG